MVDAAIIEKEAMQLSDAQRVVLAERLLESISPTSGGSEPHGWRKIGHRSD